uniref:Xylose isomerase domain TIM barrel protein n=1 Tax=uncultured Verrucomicrobiota bacterium TaxID=156588 RepID=D2DXQ3_9BACT|nr:xylose isomerase domain TIM barrel protein [uncultured Verrucomicrobiota bacterium]
MQTASVSRRSFLTTSVLAAGAAALAQEAKPKIKVGLDNFSVRALQWKAPQLLDFAAQLKCDTLFISDIESYDSLEDAALQEVKKKADDLGIDLYAGGWSICPTSKAFKPKWGTAEEHLRTGIRVAKALGSPVYRVVLGTAEDRKTEGGIRARMADTVKVLKACRSAAMDSGIKVAVENHAGDMHSWELKDLVEESGTDFVGVNIDSGNAAWTLEDPLDVLETLGRYTICSSLRDDMIWETADGAAVQWTAVGEGLIDWKTYIARWAQLCPKVPIQIETISGFSRNFPYKTAGFWTNYDKRPDKFAKFEALAKRGHKLESFKAPEGVDKKQAEEDYQRAEITRSIKYLRETMGLGLKT